jgi:hypothetical protein
MSEISYRTCEDCGEPEPFCRCGADKDFLGFWGDGEPIHESEIRQEDDPDPEDLAEERAISDLEESGLDEDWLPRQDQWP